MQTTFINVPSPSHSTYLFKALVLAMVSSWRLYQSSNSFLAWALKASLAFSSSSSFSCKRVCCSSRHFLIFSGTSFKGFGTAKEISRLECCNYIECETINTLQNKFKKSFKSLNWKLSTIPHSSIKTWSRWN